MAIVNQTLYEQVAKFTDVGFKELTTNRKIMEPCGLLCKYYVDMNGYQDV